MEIDNKRIVKAVCLGTVIYKVLNIIWNYVAPYVLYYIPVLQEDNANPYYLLTVMLSCLILWLVACRQRASGRLFTTDDSVSTAVFGRTRRISVGLMVLLTLLIYAILIGCDAVMKGVEAAFNVIGYTTLSSGAATLDVTQSWVMIVYVAFVGPVVEEIVFRGYILKGLRPLGKNYAIVISALLFTLMHGDVRQVLIPFIFGLMFGYVAMEYSIWPTILLHIINNGGYNMIVYPMIQRLPEPMRTVLHWGLFAVSIAALVYLVIRYRRRLSEYIAANHAAKGAARYLLNIWFLLFVGYCIYMIICSIYPL